MADTYPMPYMVVDGDANTEDSDADTKTFTIMVKPDTAPSFAGTVADQSYPVAEAIVPLRLPSASGGNGPLTYSDGGSRADVCR